MANRRHDASYALKLITAVGTGRNVENPHEVDVHRVRNGLDYLGLPVSYIGAVHALDNATHIVHQLRAPALEKGLGHHYEGIDLPVYHGHDLAVDFSHNLSTRAKIPVKKISRKNR